MHRLSKLSLANRSVVALLTVIIAVFGYISLGSLKQELIPSFETTQAAIVTAYPGASSEIVDSQVSAPIETAARALDNIDSTSSTSQNSLSIVRVAFKFGTETSKVKEALAGALSSIKSTLPSSADPQILIGSFDTVPIIVLGVSAKDGNLEALGKTLKDAAAPLFSPVSGVRDVTVSGIREKRINLKLKTSEMAKYNLTQQNIVSALQANGFVLPAGSITDSKGSIVIQAGTAVDTIAALKALPMISTSTSTSFGSSAIPKGATGSMPGAPTGSGTGGFGSGAGAGAGTGAGGFGSGTGTGVGTGSGAGIPSLTPTVTTKINAIKLSQIATVTYDDAPVTSISRVNGLAALSVSITKTQDANTVSVSHGVSALISDLQKKLGNNAQIVTVFDQAPYVEKSLENLSTEGLLGLTFAILIILLFLLSVRSTLVTAISIPTSVLITFIGLNWYGFSLNLFTLSALTIAIGRVVDDSIVVIENINRHLAYGEPKKTAVLNAVKEVAGAITAATITTVAVFFPITLVSGLIGELFRPFGLTFTIALVASLFVSLTIVPVLASWFLKGPKPEEVEAYENAFNRAQMVRDKEEARERRSWLQRGYLPILRVTQKRPVITIVAALLVLGYTFSLVPQLKTNFLSGGDSTSFSMTQTIAAGASLKEQDEAAAKLEAILLDNKAVDVLQTSIGSSGDGRVALGAAAGGTSITVVAKEGTDMEALKADLQKKVDADPSMGTIKISAGGPPTGGSGTVDVKLTAPNDSALREGITAVEAGMKGTPNVSEITNSLAEVQRTLKVEVDRMKAAKLGLTEIAISSIVANTMNPQSIGKVNVNSKSTAIYVVQTKSPKTVKAIEAIKVSTMSGSVKLSKIAKIKQVDVPVSITASKGDRTATVSLTPQGDNLGAITKDVTSRLDKVTLPLGVTASIGGISADQASSFSQLGLALLAAIAIVYIVMVATFGSLMQPLMLLVSIPFAATGALGLLLLTDTPLGVPALIGMLLLVGVVVTNAIVLIDLINQYRKQGRDLRESIMDGARQRLRPILMTALATIFALTPMALGITGSGGFISQPLAIVVIGGLVSSTALTLVIVPVLYWLLENGKVKRAAKRKARAEKRMARKVKPA